ncbi:MAG: class I poly(R)-hydroxyalkanoic acid synthase, partial [Ottowia sp.]|nr:class I poly(R)-hydroxyalkanoic acid synthase [Ottowia sp.]
MSTNQATQFWQEMLNQAPQGMATWMEQSQNWLRAMQQMQQGMNPAGAAQGAAPAPEMPQLTFDPGKVLDLQRDYLRQATELWNQCLHERPELKDRRFKSDAWGKNSVASFTAAMYLLNSRTLMAMAELAEGDAKAKARLRFAVEQWVSAA